MRHEPPPVFSDFLGMEGRRVAHFAGGIELRATQLDPHAQPVALSADGKVWWCGAMVFASIVEAGILRAEARKHAALERMIAEERSEIGRVFTPVGDILAPTPTTDTSARTDSALTTADAATLGLASRATIYRLLKVYPAEIMHGGDHASARWPTRASFESWLANALSARRLATTLTPMVSPKKRHTGSSPKGLPIPDGPLDAARRKIRGS